MNKFIFCYPIKLLSLNHSFITLRNGKRCRSKEYKDFAKEIFVVVNRNVDFKKFDNLFCYKNHELHAELTFYTPDLYTKAGKLSKKSCDIDNVIKPLFDNILIGKIDDSAITQLVVKKLYDIEYSFSLVLEIVDRK